jgi:hypothetical protein
MCLLLLFFPGTCEYNSTFIAGNKPLPPKEKKIIIDKYTVIAISYNIA